MKIENFNGFVKLTSEEGYMLVNNNGTISGTEIFLSKSDKTSNYKEIPYDETPDTPEPDTDPIYHVKQDKILQLKDKCSETILSGFDSTCLGYTKHFDCSLEDQTNIMGLYQIVMSKESLAIKIGLNLPVSDIEKQILNEPILWKGTGELICYEFTNEQIKRLALDMKQFINGNIEKFNELRVKVLECKEGLEISNITWD